MFFFFLLFTSVCCDMHLYPVSSMMQPSQASGHLQSPVKKTRRKKGRDEREKGDLNK